MSAYATVHSVMSSDWLRLRALHHGHTGAGPLDLHEVGGIIVANPLSHLL